MPDRLSARDASFLYMDEPSTPMHVGSVAIFDRPVAGFGYQQLVTLINERLSLLPRYRQRVLGTPARLARPVWIDDVDFDVHYHVRRSALPEPGTDEQLFELVARLMSRPLVLERPLWEIYLVEGLAGDRFALVTKTHQSMIDGFGTIDLAQLILDEDPHQPVEEYIEPDWVARKQPGTMKLLCDAVGETTRRPAELVENARAVVNDLTTTANRAGGTISGAMSTARALVWSDEDGPLQARTSAARMFAVLRTALSQYRTVRHTHGGTVNDVVLAVITGGLRQWLLSRGTELAPNTTVRALVPLAVRDADTGTPSPADVAGNDVAGRLVELPVGEPNPVLRLQHISHDMAEHTRSGESVGAGTLLRISGFAPATLHALGARAAGAFSGRIFNLLVTNSPGPQQPRYVGTARMREMFPVMPLARGQTLSIGVTSYAGDICFGLNGDRKAVPDVAALAGMMEESLAELESV